MDYIAFYDQHVEGLQKAGKQYLGWCPFHDDQGSKMRGFSVNPNDGLWWCFSCGTGGNTIQFCQRKGLDIKEAPDHDPKYDVYRYSRGTTKKRNKKNKSAFWEGQEEARAKEIFNPQAQEMAMNMERTLWICEGEKDTLTMMEAGELAIGLPSGSGDGVLEDLVFDGIPQIIIATDNDKTGKEARERILGRFPFMSWVEWPQDKPQGFDVTDLKEEAPEGFVETLRKWVVDENYNPLTRYLGMKYDRDMLRDPDALLGYALDRFESLARNIDGVQSGFYVVGAETNVAKTAFLCNLTLDLLETNEDLTGIYFSLDDNKDVIINRFLSIKSQIPLNKVQKRQSIERHQEMLTNAYANLDALARANRLYLFDASEIQDIDDLEAEIKRRKDRNLFVMIDGLYNLDTGSTALDRRRENIERANKLKELASVYRIPVICTGELRKRPVEQGRKRPPTIDDLMETGKFAYNANLVLLLWPEDWDEYDNEEEPLLKMKYAKNKLSHYRGTDTLKFHRSTSKLEED
jgi:hypothetical protein